MARRIVISIKIPPTSVDSTEVKVEIDDGAHATKPVGGTNIPQVDAVRERGAEATKPVSGNIPEEGGKALTVVDYSEAPKPIAVMGKEVPIVFGGSSPVEVDDLTIQPEVRRSLPLAVFESCATPNRDPGIAGRLIKWLDLFSEEMVKEIAKRAVAIGFDTLLLILKVILVLAVLGLLHSCRVHSVNKHEASPAQVCGAFLCVVASVKGMLRCFAFHVSSSLRRDCVVLLGTVPS